MSSTQNIEELFVSKYLCESSTLNFTRYFFKHRFAKKFVINEHHTKICNALDDVVNGKIKKLIINIAPRYGKTELAVKNFMAYGLAINPSSRFIHLSYSDDLALDNSEEVKDIVKSAEYQTLFSKVKIKPKSDSKKKWYTTEGGGVYATSTAGQVTGFGAGTVDEIEELDFNFIEDGQGNFSGALIIDDPIKPEDADSEVTRNRINERWDSTIKNRVNSRNTPIIIIMQRLHEDDLCGYLLRQSPGEWTVLSFPCLKEDNTALWPFKHTSEELNKLKRENEVVFERQYQQDPKPLKGLLFPRANLKRFKRSELKTENALSTLGFIDVADEGDDAFSFPIAKIFPKKVYIVDALFTYDGLEVTEPLAAAKIIEHDIYFTRVETNNQGKQFITKLRELTSVEKVNGIFHSQHKHTRVIMQSGFIMEYFYFLDESEYEPNSDYARFINQLCAYLKKDENKKDDAPDSLSGLAKLIRSMLPHLFTNDTTEEGN